jgi:hypothetical protein
MKVRFDDRGENLSSVNKGVKGDANQRYRFIGELVPSCS